MDPKEDLSSIRGVEIRALVQCVDGTVIGAIRLRKDLPGAYAKLHQQGWTIARSDDETAEVANTLAVDPVPTDIVLVKRDTDDQLIDSVR